MIGWILMLLLVAYVVTATTISHIKKRKWLRKRGKCNHCGEVCIMSETWTNILDDRANWKCYKCDKYNYDDETTYTWADVA